jgi:hypothetical protein
VRVYTVQGQGETAASIAAKDEHAGCPRCGKDLVAVNGHRVSVVRPNGYVDFRDPLVPGERLWLPDRWFDGSLDREPRSYFDSLPDPTGLGAAPGDVMMQPPQPTLQRDGGYPLVLRPNRGLDKAFYALGAAGTPAPSSLGAMLGRLPSWWPLAGLALGGAMALTGVALLASGKRAASNPSEPCGEYLTRSGKVGARIKRWTGADGHVWYSWSGEWGAGSLNEKDMRAEVQSWLERKRGIKIVAPFCGSET